jgi:GxxExxY protein
MVIALSEAGLKAQAQVPIPVYFRGWQVGDFKSDIVVNDAVLLELQVAKGLDPA